MIFAALLLGGIGLVDVLRPSLPGRHQWIVVVLAAAAIAGVGIAADAVPAAIAAIVGAVLWAILVRTRGRGRAGFWPVVAVAVAAAAALVVFPARTDPGWLGSVWRVSSPWGEVSVDQGMLVLAVALFLTESANAVVRMALATEGVPVEPLAHAATRVAGSATTEGAGPAGIRGAVLRRRRRRAPAQPMNSTVVEEPARSAPGPSAVLKGGRLIGPIERIIVFSLTLAAAYPLLAAFIAAKGIVRFPEISRDSAMGNRAEYFLIGSLVSWLIGLACAFAVWWAFTA